MTVPSSRARVLAIRPAIRRIMLLTPVLWGGVPPVYSATYQVVSDRSATDVIGPCSTECVSDPGQNVVLRSCTLEPQAAGGQRVTCHYATVYSPPVCGRRTAGCDGQPQLAASGRAGAVLAQMALLEADAVDAFSRLHAELLHHGAPVELLSRCLEAAEDERRHTHIMRKLSHRFGATVSIPTERTLPVRPLMELALENAREGCVRETFGAVVAAWQAGHARHPAVAAAMEVVADEEAGHAQLSHDVHAWVAARVGGTELQQIMDAQAHARAELEAEVRHTVASESVLLLGVPPPAQAVELLAHTTRELWT